MVLFVGHLGLEICLFKRDPLTSLFAVSIAGTNFYNKVDNRRFESYKNKKRTANAILYKWAI